MCNIFPLGGAGGLGGRGRRCYGYTGYPTSGRNFVLMTEPLVEHLGGHVVQVEHREKVLLTFNNYSPKAKSILLNNPPDEVDFCKL